MAFGRWIERDASRRVVEVALEAGINFLDTANLYGPVQDTGNPLQHGAS